MRTDRRDLLAALRVSLFDTPLDHIDFILILTQLRPRWLPFSNDPNALWVSFPKSHPLGMYPSTSTVDIAPSYVSVGSDEALRAWANGFGNLLNCMTSETQFTTLTVLHGSYFSEAYELSPTINHPSWLSQVVCWVKTVPARRRPDFRRASQQGVAYVAIEFPRVSHLNCLHVHSTTLILPPGLTLTLNVLRKLPNLTTFSKILVGSDIWGTVLPADRVRCSSSDF
ncbi:hypothetical protein C8R47DRAFT_1312884 [Mycena vitilis]|nr:hypothetical protein C8R47DRAFT_1312884 [Mycena vitilis]